MPTKSHRTVEMAPPVAMYSAAGYLEREWNPACRLGFAGTWKDSYQRIWYVFLCRAADGSRWLIRADAYANTGTFEPSLEREVAAELDVEVS